MSIVLLLNCFSVLEKVSILHITTYIAKSYYIMVNMWNIDQGRQILFHLGDIHLAEGS